MAVYFLLCCTVTSLVCVWGTIRMWLWLCVWMQALFISVCLPGWTVCAHVGWVCVSLFTCVHPSVCSCLVSVCLMRWLLRMLLPVPVFMQPVFVCIYTSQMCICIPVSMLSSASCLPTLKGVQRSPHVARFPLVWHVPAVHRQVFDSVCFLPAAWSRVAQKGTLEI